MYKGEILDHYKKPRNEGRLDTDHEAEGENASCGDITHIYLEVEDGEITEIKHETEGCAISTASVSILSREIKGKTVEDVRDLKEDWMLNQLGIEVSPMRMKCAMLGLETVKDALDRN